MKSVKVEDDVWEKLMELKIKKKAKSINDVLRDILNLSSNNNTSQKPNNNTSSNNVKYGINKTLF